MIKKVFIFFVSILSLVFLVTMNRWFMGEYDNIRHKIYRECEVQEEPWMTIFVHGSFASVLGLLDITSVINDDVDGTHYKKVSSRMRKGTQFFKDQPLLEKGLVYVEPTFDLHETDNKKFAAYPLLKVYEEVTERARPGKEENYFYTFGWNGLLSQKQRQKEAIRFYNAVSEALDKYHELGVYPKVRVLTHSHGGNVIAYLSAVDEVLRLKKRDALKFYQNNEYLHSALESTFNRVQMLPPRGVARQNRGQRKWDYRPLKRELEIDELILWGMPVQPETECLFAGSIFKKIYHFYSDEDLVQRLDCFSTKQGYSNRRFNLAILQSFGDKSDEMSCDRLKQIRIMVRHKIEKAEVEPKDDLTTTYSFRIIQAAEKQAISKQPESFWNILFSGGSILKTEKEDPTHKELWFLLWYDKCSADRRFILAPLPVAVFAPIFIDLVEQEANQCDYDINIDVDEKGAQFCLLEHGGACWRYGFCVEQKFLQAMKKQVKPWRVKEKLSESLFGMIRKYMGYS